MSTIIRNVSVFDGWNPALTERADIIIEGNLVKEITSGVENTERFDVIIDGSGYTAMPGLADCHAHIGSVFPLSDWGEKRPDEIAVRSTVFARDMVQRGFTTIRDAGGLVYGLKASIDNGFVPGPRIYPSHAYISQTCGHGDTRPSRAYRRLPDGSPSDPRWLNGITCIADGVPEVMRGVREQLFLGASQIKLMAGGGFSSQYDNVYTTQFTFEELKAAVDCAADYGTYVMAHIYTNEGMQRAARAGVKSFEHATFMNDETARIIKDNGIWVMPGPQFTSKVPRIGAKPKITGAPIFPREEKIRHAEHQTEMILKYDLPIIFGTDAANDVKYVAARQHTDISIFKERFGSLRTVRALTGAVYQLNKLTTYNNPYQAGKLGVLEEGSYADILLVKGNPVEDADILSEPSNIVFVMKDGEVQRNSL